MKAAVLREVNQPLTIEEIDIDSPRRGEVLVKTGATGVCHSDLHFMEGLWPARLPLVLGHEAAGSVVEVGEGVTHVQPGDHVVGVFAPFCGSCTDCLTGHPNLCREAVARDPAGRGRDAPRLSKDGAAVHQFSSLGAFAEQMLVPEGALVRVGEDAPLDRLCLVGCAVMTGLGAVFNTAQVRVGESVAVIGIGGVGLNIVQGAALAGAARIIAVDVVESKLEMARTFGATDVVNARGADPVAAVQELAGGRLDYAFEAIGKAETVRQAFDMVRPGGTAVVVGLLPVGSEVAVPGAAFISEKRLVGSFYGGTRARVDMPRLVELYRQGRLKIDELVSRRYPLEGINEAFAAMKAGEVARSVIVFD